LGKFLVWSKWIRRSDRGSCSAETEGGARWRNL
jgi:hypothetical protein